MIAKVRILAVLRGRPGLGHLTPGFNICKNLENLGCDVYYCSYGSGEEFLKNSNVENAIYIKTPNEFDDWPGLHLYPDGIKSIMPLIEDLCPHFILLGGEYFLVPILDIAKIPGAVTFNQETFYKPNHNKWFKELLKLNFSKCNLMLPINNPDYMAFPYNDSLIKKDSVICGPFHRESRSNITHIKGKRTILISNGGGCFLPQNSTSYSSSMFSSKDWAKQTFEFTLKSIQCVLERRNRNDSIFVFSGLPKDINEKIKNRFKHDDLEIFSVSDKYHDKLSVASILISRIGAGFLADLEIYGGDAIAWVLKDHNEHNQLAEKVKSHAHVKIVKSKSSLEKQIKKLMDQPDKLLTIKANAHNNSQKAAKYIAKIAGSQGGDYG